MKMGDADDERIPL